MIRSYDDAEGIEVTRQEVRRELARHNILIDDLGDDICPPDYDSMLAQATWVDLVTELGDHDTYDAQTVLGWMGY